MVNIYIQAKGKVFGERTWALAFGENNCHCDVELAQIVRRELHSVSKIHDEKFGRSGER